MPAGPARQSRGPHEGRGKDCLDTDGSAPDRTKTRWVAVTAHVPCAPHRVGHGNRAAAGLAVVAAPRLRTRRGTGIRERLVTQRFHGGHRGSGPSCEGLSDSFIAWIPFFATAPIPTPIETVPNLVSQRRKAVPSAAEPFDADTGPLLLTIAQEQPGKQPNACMLTMAGRQPEPGHPAPVEGHIGSQGTLPDFRDCFRPDPHSRPLPSPTRPGGKP